MKIKENKRGNGLLISNSEYRLIKNVISLVNKNNGGEKVKEKKTQLSFIPASKIK